ncbi:MAG: polysaccharide export protein, partial [Alphaproteobacteria bacterium]|nr:polysaccharide export protein [Alphaproteobacteria bacterium]
MKTDLYAIVEDAGSLSDRLSRLAKSILVVAGAIALAATVMACSFLPREGPLAIEIERQSSDNDYVVVDVNSGIVHTLGQLSDIGLHNKFLRPTKDAPRSTIGVGDQLAVTIWEAGEGGLFSNQTSKSASFPSVVVDRKGTISLPYAGIIQVAGKTPQAVQKGIINRLEGQAIRPQVMVTTVKNEHNTVVVNGDVSRPGRYPISLDGDRLLDVIASAGGTKFPARETYVTFIRDKTRAVQLVTSVIDDPNENIYVVRGDRIYLSHDPKRYTVLGAVTKPGIYVFQSARINVLEAVASAGGLLDNRADSSGLFVFRYEQPRTLDQIGVRYARTITGRVPTIYRIDMSHAKSYFYAQSFLLQDKDSVFVSNAKGVEVSKVLKMLNLATASVGNV